MLLEAYRVGTWTPQAAECDVAEGLARACWSGDVLVAVLRDLPSAARTGRLVEVLQPAVDVLDLAVDLEDTVLQLRVLVDALTATP